MANKAAKPMPSTSAPLISLPKNPAVLSSWPSIPASDDLASKTSQVASPSSAPPLLDDKKPVASSQLKLRSPLDFKLLNSDDDEMEDIEDTSKHEDALPA